MIEQVALTGSTNADLLIRAAQSAPEGLWLRADAQDSGRGRLGRRWMSEPGNVFASTIVRLRPTDPASSTLAFVAGLAAHETLRQIAPEFAIQLKWPNDILTANGAKLCGILLERIGDAVIAGFGINLAHHPDTLDRPVSDLRSLGANPPEAQAVTEMLADNFARWLHLWRNTPLDNVLRAWDAAAHRHGSALSVHQPDGGKLDGLYVGLEPDGALRLRLADGQIRAIHAADVFLI
ncbi:MAG: biotin--[acetyl-CoA-carboxylase] ligase [Sphingomonadales bacterium]|nr:biotin--[acetyl-CoA-carboxylase] ligase [Sphingomonadales bacterium]